MYLVSTRFLTFCILAISDGFLEFRFSRRRNERAKMWIFNWRRRNAVFSREKILIAALLGKSLRCDMKDLPGKGKKAKSTDEQRKRTIRILMTKRVLFLPFSILDNLPEVV